MTDSSLFSFSRTMFALDSIKYICMTAIIVVFQEYLINVIIAFTVTYLAIMTVA